MRDDHDNGGNDIDKHDCPYFDCPGIYIDGTGNIVHRRHDVDHPGEHNVIDDHGEYYEHYNDDGTVDHRADNFHACLIDYFADYNAGAFNVDPIDGFNNHVRAVYDAAAAILADDGAADPTTDRPTPDNDAALWRLLANLWTLDTGAIGELRAAIAARYGP